jgi:hypothetical protein
MDIHAHRWHVSQADRPNLGYPTGFVSGLALRARDEILQLSKAVSYSALRRAAVQSALMKAFFFEKKNQKTFAPFVQFSAR